MSCVIMAGIKGTAALQAYFPQNRTYRTADDFVRDMKAKQQHSTSGASLLAHGESS